MLQTALGALGPRSRVPWHGQRGVKLPPKHSRSAYICLDFTLEFEIQGYKETFIFLPFNDQTSGAEAQGSGVSITRAVFFLL